MRMHTATANDNRLAFKMGFAIQSQTELSLGCSDCSPVQGGSPGTTRGFERERPRNQASGGNSTIWAASQMAWVTWGRWRSIPLCLGEAVAALG
ncbi:hypothetical protein CNMCM5623_004990 [Aspergillus felis]|uniref:Uncharacterized protein n=1 Tax=Aspergillus felis TaxID=1287682 RepID=A0A8H6UNE3_9EURO|nr:hypothetical protein CNMCM5623_004990 [Aspergillus felis]